MEITIRHVLEVSPQLAELLGRLLAGVAMQSTAGAAQQAAPATSSAGGGHVAECEDANTDERRPDVGTAPAALDPAPGAAPTPADHIADTGKMVPAEVPAQRGEWRTAERFAVLERMYPAGVDLMEIRAALAALDGPPLPEHQNRIAHWARDRGLSRPSDGAEPWRTPERAALLKETWEAGVDPYEIAEAMRKLPGGPVEHRRLSIWAAQLDLKRPADYMARLSRERNARIRAARWGASAAVQGDAAMELIAAADGPVSDPPAPSVAVVPEPARVAAPEPPVAPRVTAPPPKLPAPSNGRVHASFREIRAWAFYFGIIYTGTNIEAVNNRRRLMKLAPLVQDDDRTAADTKPERPAPPPLPAPVDGLVRASFREIKAWAAHYGVVYDGGNADVVNRRRAGLGLPPVAQCEIRTRADSARAA